MHSFIMIRLCNTFSLVTWLFHDNKSLFYSILSINWKYGDKVIVRQYSTEVCF